MSNTTNSSITVIWKSPTNGSVDWYNVTFYCKSPNNVTQMEVTQTVNATSTTATASGLDPGTFCNMSVLPFVWNMLSGNSSDKDLSPSSNETGNCLLYLKQSCLGLIDENAS